MGSSDTPSTPPPPTPSLAPALPPPSLAPLRSTTFRVSVGGASSARACPGAAHAVTVGGALIWA
jgi:hypothetical protein